MSFLESFILSEHPKRSEVKISDFPQPYWCRELQAEFQSLTGRGFGAENAWRKATTSLSLDNDWMRDNLIEKFQFGRTQQENVTLSNKVLLQRNSVQRASVQWRCSAFSTSRAWDRDSRVSPLCVDLLNRQKVRNEPATRDGTGNRSISEWPSRSECNTSHSNLR